MNLGQRKIFWADVAGDLIDPLDVVQAELGAVSADDLLARRLVHAVRLHLSFVVHDHMAVVPGDLRKVLLDPLGPGGSRVYCPVIFDHSTNSPVPMRWSVADHGAVLVFDGIFLHRPELRDAWDFSIFLDAPFEVTIPRGAGRGPGWGSADVHAPSNRRYIEGQRLYLRKNQPQGRATIVIDYSDITKPIVNVRRWPT